jgi:hypothetical protein
MASSLLLALVLVLLSLALVSERAMPGCVFDASDMFVLRSAFVVWVVLLTFFFRAFLGNTF